MRNPLVLSVLLSAGVLAGSPLASAANSLVFCSEGSPAGFDTAQYTTATDNDAAEPIYNRLAEFEKVAPQPFRPWQRAGMFPKTA